MRSRILEISKEFIAEITGRRAFIVGKDHPHNGASATCMGADKTGVGWGIRFKNLNTGEEFYVFHPNDIQWKP